MAEHAASGAPAAAVAQPPAAHHNPTAQMQELNLTSADGRYAYTIHTDDMLT